MNSVWCDAGAPTQRSSCVAAWRRRLAAGLVAVASTFGSPTTSIAVTSPAPVHRYQYLGANPLTRGDTTGLTYDDSWVDDFEADYTGHRLNALGTINEGARWASLGLQTTLDIAGSLLGVVVFQSVAVLAAGGGGFWEAMNILMSANPVGRLGAIGGKISKAFGYMWRGGQAARVAGTAAEHLFKRGSYRERS